MFVLRIIEETRENENEPFDQVIENFELGTAYTRLKSGVTKEFDQVMEKEFADIDKSNVESLICGENGAIYFIEKNNENKVYHYFIMTEVGQTFERL